MLSNSMKTKYLILLIISMLFPVAFMTGCASAPTGELIAFSYHYGQSWSGGWDFDITENEIGEGDDPEKKYRFYAEKTSSSMYYIGYVGQNVLDEINEIIDEYNLYTWNGFNKNDQHTDGSAFSFSATYTQGNIIANGYSGSESSFPKNFHEVNEALWAYLVPLAESFGLCEIEDSDEVAFYRVSITDNTGFVNLEVRETELFLKINGTDPAGLYDYDIRIDDYDRELLEDFELYVRELYNLFRDEHPNNGFSQGDEYCLLSLETLKDGITSLGLETYINKERHPEEYERLLKSSLALCDIQVESFDSEEYRDLAYNQKILYPQVFFYDSDGLGKVIIDMVERTILWEDEVYTTSRETMLDFVEVSLLIKNAEYFNPSTESKSFLYGFPDYDSSAPDTFAIDMFEEYISQGNTWVAGVNGFTPSASMYGFKDERPYKWDDLVSEVVNLIEKSGKQ